MRRQLLIQLLIIALLAITTSNANSATAVKSDDGKLSDGRNTYLISLKSASGISARVLTYGATLQSYYLPDNNQQFKDVVLGHSSSQDYENVRNFFGVTVGRFANRIAKGRFSLDGKTYQVSINNGENSLHGGLDGFDRRLWQIADITQGDSASVTLSLTSPDGDMGYPGKMESMVTYALSDIGDLTITMEATTTKPTIVNMTNHALFNMAGHCATNSAMNNVLTIPASHYTPVDDSLIPTGEFSKVKDTPFDFRAGKPLYQGLRDASDPQIAIARGFDHNWAVDAGLTEAPKLVARIIDPVSGRTMEMLSTEPGLQMYTGNFINGSYVGKDQCLYRMGDGYALEPQKFPNAPNQANFISARLNPNQTYRHVMVLRSAN